MESTKNEMFPIFLKLDQLNLLIVGGGYVGLEKLEAVLRNSPGAKIDQVATEFLQSEILELAGKHPTVQLHTRPFQDTDLDGKDLVICATDSRELHQHIKAMCKQKNLLCNVADTPDLCDFYLSSVVQKGNLKIAISSNGKSPTLTKRIREYLEAAIPDNVDELLDNLKNLRDQLKGDFEYKVKTLNEVTKNWMGKSDKPS